MAESHTRAGAPCLNLGDTHNEKSMDQRISAEVNIVCCSGAADVNSHVASMLGCRLMLKSPGAPAHLYVLCLSSAACSSSDSSAAAAGLTGAAREMGSPALATGLPVRDQNDFGTSTGSTGAPTDCSDDDGWVPVLLVTALRTAAVAGLTSDDQSASATLPAQEENKPCHGDRSRDPAVATSIFCLQPRP